MLGSDGREDFAVQFDACDFQSVDQFAVAHSQFASGGVDADRPDLAGGALFQAAALEGVNTSFQEGHASQAQFGVTFVAVSFGVGEQVAALFGVQHPAFYSSHRLRDVFLYELGERDNGHVGALVAGHFTRFSGVKVVLTSLAFDDLAVFGGFHAFAESFVGFVGHTEVWNLLKRMRYEVLEAKK